MDNQLDCVKCVLWRCDLDTDKPCRFVLITVDEYHEQKAARIRQQKRDHNAKVRAARREEARELRLIFSRMLTDYGTYGKHEKVMRIVRGVYG